MSKQLFSGNLNIDFGQFYIDVLVDDEDDSADYLEMESAFEDQKNGLCGACHDGKLYFVVGPQSGVIDLTIELHDKEPVLNDSCEDIVECFLSAKKNNLHLCEWGHENTYKLGLPAGDYIVRYSIQALDKDYGHEDEGDRPVAGQKYFVQFWPGSVSEDKIVRSQTKTGQYWHSEMGVGNG